jgi:hypothetical protein
MQLRDWKCLNFVKMLPWGSRRGCGFPPSPHPEAQETEDSERADADAYSDTNASFSTSG